MTAADPPGEGRGWTALLPRLHFFEVLALAFLVSTVLFLRAVGLRIGWEVVAYTIPRMSPELLVGLAWGVPLHVGWCLIRRRPVIPYLRGLTGRAWLLLTVRIWIALNCVAFAYIWLKVSIPLFNHRLWDAELFRLDAFLHLGLSPSRFAVSALEGSLLLGLFDRWYAAWLFTALLGLGFFCGFLDPLVRKRFVTSHALLWTLGAWLYVAAPSLGPIYLHQAGWDPIREELPRAAATQDDLWENYTRVLAGRSGPLPRLNPTLGVAAFPSLHVGIHWLLTLWARRHARPLFIPFALGTGLTFIGSIVTGWHYAVDGYAGLLLAQVAYLAAVAGGGRDGAVRGSTRSSPDDPTGGPLHDLPAAEEDR